VTEYSPQRDEIAQAPAEQASTVLKGFASAFGFGDALKAARQTRHLAAAIGSPYCIV